MLNLFFIGGAGFLGSGIIETMLKTSQCKVVVLEPLYANVSRLDGLNVTLLRGNLSDLDLIEIVLKQHHIDKVVHLVSTMVPGCGYDEYKQEFENVIFPTIRLMQLCSRMNIQFVFFSSGGTVYGERKTLEPFVETDPKEPISYYGLSKQMIENSIQFEHRVSGLNYLIFRPSNPYGHGQNIHGRQGLIAVALGRILEGEPITIWGDGSSVRDYIYIDDLTHIVSVLINSGIMNKIINIGSGEGHSVNQIVAILKEVVSEEVKVDYTPSRKNDVSNMILSNEELYKYVDFKLTPLKEGIALFYKTIKQSIIGNGK